MFDKPFTTVHVLQICLIVLKSLLNIHSLILIDPIQQISPTVTAVFPVVHHIIKVKIYSQGFQSDLQMCGVSVKP